MYVSPHPTCQTCLCVYLITGTLCYLGCQTSFHYLTIQTKCFLNYFLLLTFKSFHFHPTIPCVTCMSLNKKISSDAYFLIFPCIKEKKKSERQHWFPTKLSIGETNSVLRLSSSFHCHRADVKHCPAEEQCGLFSYRSLHSTDTETFQWETS